jgi:hypothetical protein
LIQTPISDLVLAHLKPTSKVIDIGGARYPYFRADAILDKRTYDQMIKPIAFAGRTGEMPRFTRESWVTRDFYDLPWPFPDKHFDFSLCMGTLEDLRDPLPICREIQRISKAGYISTPTRACESMIGISEHPASSKLYGYFHHRWFVEIDSGGLLFKMKSPLLHQHPQWLTRRLGQHTLNFFWQDSVDAREIYLAGHDDALKDLEIFAARHIAWLDRSHTDRADTTSTCNHWPQGWGPRPAFLDLIGEK